MSARKDIPEITEEEAQVLEELAEMRESDPEGYEALIGDLGTDGGAEEEGPAGAHAEQLLQMLTTSTEEQLQGQLSELFNAAYQQRAEESK